MLNMQKRSLKDGATVKTPIVSSIYLAMPSVVLCMLPLLLVVEGDNPSDASRLPDITVGYYVLTQDALIERECGNVLLELSRGGN